MTTHPNNAPTWVEGYPFILTPIRSTGEDGQWGPFSTLNGHFRKAIGCEGEAFARDGVTYWVAWAWIEPERTWLVRRYVKQGVKTGDHVRPIGVALCPDVASREDMARRFRRACEATDVLNVL